MTLHLSFLLGCAITFAGLAMWSIPLALVVVGILLAALSWLAWIGQRTPAGSAEQDGK